MKITALELFHISIPFAKPYHLSKLESNNQNVLSTFLLQADGFVELICGDLDHPIFLTMSR